VDGEQGEHDSDDRSDDDRHDDTRQGYITQGKALHLVGISSPSIDLDRD
jgi:hypothetical protein